MPGVDGYYSAHMTGAQGQGFVLFIFNAGTLVGCDPLGVIFDGSYAIPENGQGYEGKVTVKAPPNGTLIQGVSTGPNGLIYEVDFQIPPNFSEQPFIKIKTPLGPVNMKFAKLRELEQLG